MDFLTLLHDINSFYIVMDPVFEKLCIESDQAEEKIRHLPDLEPYLSKILEHIIAHPENKPYYLQRFKEIMSGKDRIRSTEIIAYCMRELQWQEIKEECETWFNDPSQPLRDYLGNHGIYDTYTSDWDGDIFYARYQHRRVLWKNQITRPLATPITRTWYFVLRTEDFQEAPRFEIQILNDEGKAVATGYVFMDTQSISIMGNAIPAPVIATAKTCEKGKGIFVGTDGLEINPFTQ